MKKQILLTLISIFLLLGLNLTGASILPISSIKTSEVETNNQSKIDQQYLSNLNKRQTPYDCGAYNITFVLSILKDAKFDENKIKKSLKKIPRLGVFPEQIKKLLNHYDLTATVKRAGKLTEEQKTNYLKSQLEKEKILIILGKKQGFQHYVTLLGYDENNFYVYDPFLPKGKNGLTVEQNGKKSGNRTMEKNKFLDFWKGGGVLGFYEDVLIEVLREG